MFEVIGLIWDGTCVPGEWALQIANCREHDWVRAPDGKLCKFISKFVLRPCISWAALSQWLSAPGILRQACPWEMWATRTGNFGLMTFYTPSCGDSVPTPHLPWPHQTFLRMYCRVKHIHPTSLPSPLSPLRHPCIKVLLPSQPVPISS